MRKNHPPPTPGTVSTVTLVPSIPALRLHSQRGAWCMIVSLICFTGNALLLKYLTSLRHIDPWVSMSFRAGIGLLLMVIFFGPQGTLRLKRSFQNWLLSSRGVIGAVATACYYLSIGPLGAGKATLIGNTWCIFAAVLAAWLLKEKLGPVKLCGIIITLAGLGLLTEIELSSLAGFGKYEIISLVGAVLAAVVVVVIRQLTRTETSATIFSSQCIYGVILAVPFALAHQQTLHALDILLLVAAALSASVGQIAMTEGFRYLTVTAGGAFQSMIPMIISLSSISLFQETFTWAQACGGLLVIWGTFQTIVGGRSRRDVAIR